MGDIALTDSGEPETRMLLAEQLAELGRQRKRVEELVRWGNRIAARLTLEMVEIENGFLAEKIVKELTEGKNRQSDA